VFTGAENMLDHQRRDIHSVTGATITDQYGFSEGCGNASQCDQLVYHEDFEYGILECVDPEPLPSGDVRGRIIATGFASLGFPFLRYDTGDIGIWANPGFRCLCGRQSRVLKSIEGRVDDYVITPEGRRIMRFDYLFKDSLAIREAQVVQASVGQIVIRVVLEPNAGDGELESIRQLVAQWISPLLRVEFEVVEQIERQRNGKFKAVVSGLSHAAREGRADA
jgi:phenylacetate-CoA ligase